MKITVKVPNYQRFKDKQEAIERKLIERDGGLWFRNAPPHYFEDEFDVVEIDVPQELEKLFEERKK